MKKCVFLLLFLISGINLFSQTASDYFPASTGYRWYYKTTPLDSNNNPQVNQSRFRLDSFAVVQLYQGLNASIVYSKTNLTSFTQNAPFNDTLRFNFQASNGFAYLKLLPGLDTIAFLDTTGIVNFLKSFETWYNTYRFASPVGTNYTIITRDTTLHVDTLTLPLRLSMTGRRLADETISTVNGNLLCKKFLLTPRISYLVSFPPLPPIPVTILERPDTVWVTSGKWMAKDVAPSSRVDLTTFGIPVRFTIPGSMTELTNPSLGIVNYSNEVPAGYRLEQNYPNPFNPSTIISCSIPEKSFVKLKVFNIAGEEISTLVNEELPAGKYDVKFTASKLTSGVYFYTLEAGKFKETKRMLLVK
jgi:hypothetical protein